MDPDLILIKSPQRHLWVPSLYADIPMQCNREEWQCSGSVRVRIDLDLYGSGFGCRVFTPSFPSTATENRVPDQHEYALIWPYIDPDLPPLKSPQPHLRLPGLHAELPMHCNRDIRTANSVPDRHESRIDLALYGSGSATPHKIDKKHNFSHWSEFFIFLTRFSSFVL